MRPATPKATDALELLGKRPQITRPLKEPRDGKFLGERGYVQESSDETPPPIEEEEKPKDEPVKFLKIFYHLNRKAKRMMRIQVLGLLKIVVRNKLLRLHSTTSTIISLMKMSKLFSVSMKVTSFS